MPSSDPKQEFKLLCPAPITSEECIVLAHGGGGRMTSRLIDDVFAPAFDNPYLAARHDSAVLPTGACTGSRPRIAFTTDSYVVQPLIFPGGDIGTLAVNGTVNDLAMAGARPRWLSAAFILEEGLPISTLQHVVQSMRRAADIAQVQIVTGDTKVVDHGKGDGIFITTAGIGEIEHDLELGPAGVQNGDIVLLSGDIARHGTAVMLQREGLGLEGPTIASDCASVADAALSLIDAGIPVRCMRDLTRGGLATALVEIAVGSEKHIHIQEDKIPVQAEVQAACELLGFDPLYIANEGRFIAFVPLDRSDEALALLRQHKDCRDARAIGTVRDDRPGQVSMRSVFGANRLISMLSGEQLPRIC